MSSVTTERFYKSLFYKFFFTNLSQVVLRWFYTEQLYNTTCVTLIIICLISSFHKSEKIELIQSFKNRIIHISMQKVATISRFTRSD